MGYRDIKDMDIEEYYEAFWGFELFKEVARARSKNNDVRHQLWF